MNISYRWLRELCETPLAPRELAARLTSVGLAVDAVHEAGEDLVLEIDLTSNRPDCLSHLGVARELAAKERAALTLPSPATFPTNGRAGDFVSVGIEDAGLCPRYTARVVRGVRVAPSPAWLAERLQAIGQRPINNVADVTNYVLHELGQPLHAFDLASLRGPKIVVRRARAGERLKTLDGVECALDAEMLIIADAERAVALAGVMGGEETEVTGDTRDVLIESAFFAPASVRRTSQALGLSTEASRRFERGVDPEGALRAQERAAALVCELAGGEATVDSIDVYPGRLVRPVVRLRFGRVKSLAALDVPPRESIRVLTALGFEPREDGAGERREVVSARVEVGVHFAPAEAEAGAETRGGAEASFVVPSWRFDVEREEDLVEEVARHVGYERIGEELPAARTTGEYREGDSRRRAARRALNALGFDEAISFSFIDASHAGQFETLSGLLLEGEAAPSPFVTLSNPIIEGLTLMRPSLLPGLLDAVRRNFNHGTRDVRLFELGRVFAARGGGELPFERTSLGLVLTGGAVEEGKAAAARELDFYDLKGTLEAVADAAGVGSLVFEEAVTPHLREGQSAQASLHGRVVVTLGKLSEDIAAAYKFRQAVYVAELDFSALLAAPAVAARYSPLPRHPAIVRDVSLLVSRRVAFADLRRAALAHGGEHCRGVSLVDVYEGANVPEGQRSLTLRAEYRADERTLRDEEAEEVHRRLVAALEREFGARQRA